MDPSLEPRSWNPSMKVDRVPTAGATNDQLAVGINQLHECVENIGAEVGAMKTQVEGMALVVLPLNKRVSDLEALPLKIAKAVVVTGGKWFGPPAAAIAVAILYQNYIQHQETSRKQDVAAVASTVAAQKATLADEKVSVLTNTLQAN